MREGFDGKQFQKVWQGLDDVTRQAMKDKAEWEHVSLSAVMKNYYPELWAQVKSGIDRSICPGCGGKKYERAKTCRSCTEFVSGENHPMWNGGRHETIQGYITILFPGHSRADSRGYVFEQNILAERALGRPLPEAAVVHHHNEIRSDNGPGNLVLCEDRSYHQHLHSRKRAYVATGDARARWCSFCKHYETDYSVVMAITKTSTYHPPCRNKYVMEKWHLKKKVKVVA